MAKHAIDYSMFEGPQNFGKWMDVHSAPSCPTEVIKRSTSMVLPWIIFDVAQVTIIWMVISPSLFRAQARAPVEHLIGQFASGMTSLLGKLRVGRPLMALTATRLRGSSRHLLQNGHIGQLVAVAGKTTTAPRSSLTRKMN